MKIVNVYEAKSQLSRLLSDVEAGQEVVIARAGKPIAKLIAYRTPRKRVLGTERGKIKLTKTFFQADREIADMFLNSTEAARYKQC